MRSLIKDMIKPFKSASVCIWGGGGGGGEREGSQIESMIAVKIMVK